MKRIKTPMMAWMICTTLAIGALAEPTRAEALTGEQRTSMRAEILEKEQELVSLQTALTRHEMKLRRLEKSSKSFNEAAAFLGVSWLFSAGCAGFLPCTYGLPAIVGGMAYRSNRISDKREKWMSDVVVPLEARIDQTDKELRDAREELASATASSSR